jgi:hypothetical protein
MRNTSISSYPLHIDGDGHKMIIRPKLQRRSLPPRLKFEFEFSFEICLTIQSKQAIGIKFKKSRENIELIKIVIILVVEAA